MAVNVYVGVNALNVLGVSAEHIVYVVCCEHVFSVLVLQLCAPLMIFNVYDQLLDAWAVGCMCQPDNFVCVNAQGISDRSMFGQCGVCLACEMNMRAT